MTRKLIFFSYHNQWQIPELKSVPRLKDINENMPGYGNQITVA